MRVGPRTATLVLATVGGTVVAAFMLGVIIMATGGASPWRLPAAMMLFGPLIAGALAIDQGFRQQVTLAEAEQAATNRKWRLAAARAHAVRRHEERRLSRALHGPVQTAVTAAAMHIDAGDAPGAEALLVNALGELDRGADDVAPVTEALSELVALWSGLCTVAVELGTETASAIDDEAPVAGAFMDICAEACSNAVRHGGAQHVRVRASCTRDHVEVEVHDDGAPVGNDARPGLGAAMLDEVTVSWERTRDGDVTVLSATLPLAPARD